MEDHNKYTIYVSTFGKKVLKIRGGIPIEVGAAGRENFLYSLRDDTGKNISKENEYYGELTGLYWVWKNTSIADDDIIGFCHYNKALNITRRRACAWLRKNENGIITLKPSKIRNHPVPDEVQAVMSILHERQELYTTWDKLYDDEAAAKGAFCRGGNMFITSGHVFKDYCSWLFDILTKMRAIVGDKPNTDANMRRYCAFMGERLLSVYIESHKLPVKEVPIRSKWWLNYIRPIVKFLKINRNSSIYLFLRKRYGYNSQYHRA